MDFSIEYISTFSAYNLSNFEEGLRGRLLKLISLYIKILFVEKKINENDTGCNGGVPHVTKEVRVEGMGNLTKKSKKWI